MNAKKYLQIVPSSYKMWGQKLIQNVSKYKVFNDHPLLEVLAHHLRKAKTYPPLKGGHFHGIPPCSTYRHITLINLDVDSVGILFDILFFSQVEFSIIDEHAVSVSGSEERFDFFIPSNVSIRNQ